MGPYHRTTEQQGNEQIRRQSNGVGKYADDNGHPRDINKCKLTWILSNIHSRSVVKGTCALQSVSTKLERAFPCSTVHIFSHLHLHCQS